MNENKEIITGKEIIKAPRQLEHLSLLQRYMQEVSRFELLSPEQEHRLAVEYHKTQDPQIALRLITANLRLVVKIALEHRSYYSNLLDLIQEGNIGLMQAVRRFDPFRGVRLPSYAQWWIRAYILKFILDNFSLVRIGTTQAQRRLFFRLRKEQERLFKEGLEPDFKLLAERIQVPEAEVVEMQKRLAGPEASLDSAHPVTGKPLMESIAHSGMDLESQVAREEMLDKVRSAMDEFRKTLSDRELAIWDTRIASEDPLTFKEIGEKYGVTRQRMQQIEQRLKERFKKFLDSRMQTARQKQAEDDQKIK
jgi:RNA polymerase sigma-32 factor